MTKNNLKIKVELYAVIPYLICLFENKVLQDRFNKLINEILGMSTGFMSIQSISEADSVDKLIDNEHKNGLLSINTILKFTYNSEYVQSDFTETSNSELAGAIYTSKMENHAINFLYCKVSDLMTCANICMPGVLAMKKCFIYKDGKYIRSVDFFTFQNTIQSISSDLSGELYNKKIDLLSCVYWFNKIVVNNNYSSTPLGRAIGSLNHLLFSELHESNATIWTLVGIEALYCRDGDITKGRQIVDKSAIIVSMLKNSKDIKKMYDGRSRFLHGDIDFPLYPSLPAYVSLDSDEEKLNQEKKHLHTALNLMFETLQYMVINKRHDLNFKRSYTLE